jgi:hypothetical protein
MPHDKLPKPATETAATKAATDAGAVHRLPPAGAKIPAVPAGFVPTNGSDYFRLLPKRAEREAIARAVAELRASSELQARLGTMIPPVEDIAAVFEAAEKWSTMRAQASEWDLYCRTHEGLAWKNARAMMARVKPPFNLAVQLDNELGLTFRGLKQLLNTASEIAHRAVATKREKKRKKAEEEAAARAAKEGGGEGGSGRGE